MKHYDLVGQDGNAFSVMGYTVRAMRYACHHTKEGKEQFGEEAQTKYKRDAMLGDYDNLLCVSVETLDKINSWIEQQPDFEGWDDDDEYPW